ncbi:hypothetical protein BJ878DRAFT_506455 [Calycina marina]|uniref:DNA mismatch repair protein HSM3 N-terminal domain-containing protein n=1 Tax=Calycina marina TaxID=1763456 RepID=A0A9P7Z327_9HELO|nr:hypothetical protein BJ878DRAFT_506455 [Calycina marina]
MRQARLTRLLMVNYSLHILVIILEIALFAHSLTFHNTYPLRFSRTRKPATETLDNCSHLKALRPIKMDTTPVAGAEGLEKHLLQLLDAPEMLLNVNLFDQVDIQLNETNIPPLIPRLLPKLTQILGIYQKDPTVLASLAIKLLQPIRFAQSLTLASEESLIQALRSPAPSANILGITVVEKAALSPGDTAIMSIMKGVVEALIRTWLSTPHVEVGEKATKALRELLDVDCDRRTMDKRMDGMEITSRRRPGQGLLWRRIFQDRDIYKLIFNLCSFKTAGKGEGQLDERQKSLAQARLLRLLPLLAVLDFHTISHSHFPDVEAEYELQGEVGVLWFAATHMINKEEDMLMHITAIDFFAEFLDALSMTEIGPPTMVYLKKLLRKVTESDQTMYKSLESIALNPKSTPELVDLLVKLNKE